MNPHTIARLFPHASKSLLAANAHDYGSGKAAEPQPADRKQPLARNRAPEKTGADRFHLRIVSVRKRLCDPDNIVAKWTIDALRYAGIIPDDTPEILTLEITQRKRAKGEAEHTLIELWLCSPK